MAQITKEIRDKISTQIQNEIFVARQKKRSRISQWHKNENVLQEKKNSSINDKEPRSQVSLYKAQGFISTILSKIDTPMIFRYLSKHIGDANTVKLMNALVDTDSDRDNWDYKDLLGKHSALVYGRVVFSYYATSFDGEYKPNLTIVDPYDFLIDPSCGGVSLQDARYCGNYNVIFDKQELEAGIKDGRFLKEETSNILMGQSNKDEITQETSDKDNRYFGLKNDSTYSESVNSDLFKFWNWYTIFEGEKYYAVFSETFSTLIRLEKLSDITKSNLYPFWSYATHPDASEFWSLGYLDFARDIFQAQSLSINQMIDNSDRIIYAQRAINTSAIYDESELRFKRNGIIRFKDRGIDTPTDINSVLKVVESPSIQTPIEIYNTLENVLQLIQGVTSSVQGLAEEDKVAIYEGNIAAASDRFNLLNKSYSNGYKQFAQIYKWGVQEHLKKPQAVKLIGINGVEISMVNRKNLKPLADYDVAVQSSSAESQSDYKEKRAKLDFIAQYVGGGLINDSEGFRMSAEISGFNRDDIRRLTDKDNTYEQEMISEASRDIEHILRGEDVKPNMKADRAYFQYFYDYMLDKQENISDKQFADLARYAKAVKPMVMRNMAFDLQKELAKQGNLGLEGVPDMEEMQILDEPQQEIQTQESQPLQDQPLQDQFTSI